MASEICKHCFVQQECDKYVSPECPFYLEHEFGGPPQRWIAIPGIHCFVCGEKLVRAGRSLVCLSCGYSEDT